MRAVNAKCRMLATYLGGYFRCPTNMARFHYHGETLASGMLELTSMRRLCYHRHQTAEAAKNCTEKGN